MSSLQISTAAGQNGGKRSFDVSVATDEANHATPDRAGTRVILAPSALSRSSMAS
jgi:hypothetical protein